MSTPKTPNTERRTSNVEIQKPSLWRTLPVVGFFTRYWLILAVLMALVALVFSGWVFSTVGAMVWLPAVGVGGWAFVLLVINLFFRRTIDRDFDTGRFGDEWHKAKPELRLILTVATTLVLFLGYCLIAAGLATR